MELLSAFMVAGIASLALTINVVAIEFFSHARLGVALAFLVLAHLLRYPKFVFNREIVAYSLFFAYMSIQLLWTHDIRLAMNTLVPAADFLLVLILFGSLTAYYDIRAILMGMLAGVLAGAGIYTLASGFPFVRPLEFSYNAIASVYLFGLFISLLLISFTRAQILLRFVGLLFLLLVVATASIKTNLGVLLGVAGVSAIYFKQVARALRRNGLALVILGMALGPLVVSNDTFMEAIKAGVDRVTLGVEILEARENLPGYSGLDNRRRWVGDGLAGWRQNPIFGHGVEAFRSRYGITSHTTPVDLLYNSGLIGFTLFFYIFVSIMRRLLAAQQENTKHVAAVILGMTICYLFISMSGTMHYNAYLAAFLGISSVLLSQTFAWYPRQAIVTSTA